MAHPTSPPSAISSQRQKPGFGEWDFRGQLLSDFPDFSELDGLNLSGRFIGKQIPGLLEKKYQQIQQTLSVII